MTYDPYRHDILAEVASLERDLREHVVDLDEAFSLRDWAAVARIYRQIARLADRLEELDPDARSRTVERVEREQAVRDEAYVNETDELDELAMRGNEPAVASRFLGEGGSSEIDPLARPEREYGIASRPPHEDESAES